uniref:F-box protein n=1 Tax=Ananas comosus var. bracteatus TaxID=296719 RepID=A0A6V7QV90_ANACO
MEKLPGELCLKIFQFLDHQSIATAIQVCRRWRRLASDDELWCNLFRERWGGDAASFYAPQDSKSWKDVYVVQDRCDRYGLGLKIIREGNDYYLIHQGEIQRHLGSGHRRRGYNEEVPLNDEDERELSEISNRILFFLGDLEAACADAKRGRL